MLGILLNISLLLFWGLLIYFSRRNLATILIGVGIGVLGVFSLAGLIEFNWFKITGISLTEEQSKTVIAPIVEESSKLLFLFLVAWFTHHKRILLEIELFGASAGLGFAFIENFGVIANPLNVLLRGFFSWPMHIATATLLSYSVTRILKSRSKRNTFWTLSLFLTAMGIHSIFNYTILYLGFH
jgi:RsiW-degrading membrane proteinase PrsW (M82 family)